MGKQDKKRRKGQRKGMTIAETRERQALVARNTAAIDAVVEIWRERFGWQPDLAEWGDGTSDEGLPFYFAGLSQGLKLASQLFGTDDDGHPLERAKDHFENLCA